MLRIGFLVYDSDETWLLMRRAKSRYFFIRKMARRMGARGLGARITTIFIAISVLSLGKSEWNKINMERGITVAQNLFMRQTAPKAIEIMADSPSMAQVGRNNVVSTPIPNAGSAIYPISHSLQHFIFMTMPFRW